MALFVNILGDRPNCDGDARRLVRSHVMKDFRQKEREAARQNWRAATDVMADMSCDPKKSQFIRLDHGRRGARRPGGQTPEPSTPPGNSPDSTRLTVACEKPMSKSRHMSKSPRPRNGPRKPRRKNVPSTDLDASISSTITAQSCKMYLTETISDTIRSPEAYRQQLMLTFLALHYSSAMPNLHLAFPKMQARLNSSRTSILTLATDAVLLHALAVSKNDDSLLWTARRRNNAAIAGLRSSLLTSRDCTSDDILLTTDALAFFDAGSSTAWRHHANGLAALIRARGPSIYSSIGLLLHAPMLQLLMEALLWRGPFVFGEVQWLDAVLPTCRTRMSRLLYLGCQVPDVVKRTDGYLSQDEIVRATADLDSLMDSLTALKRSLQEWLSEWYRAEFPNKTPYTTTTAHTERLNVGLPTLPNPPPLPSTYTFPSLREAFAHNIFWTLLLTLRQARCQLSASLPSPSKYTLAPQKAAAGEAADSLLRSVPFILRGVSALPGGLPCSAGPLIVAERWYATCGEETNERKEWCQETVNMLTEGGERPAGWITRSCAAWITAVL
ncbi:hypothetical protein Q7P35_006618 [Cladosporium inversicolor]